MPLVDNDSFLQRLASLFEAANKKGSAIWLTHKRLTYEDGDATMAPVEGVSDDKEYACLIRATDGKKIKISTQVFPDDLEKFNAAYGTLLKSSMPTLRKRDKKKEKERAERIALRKKRMTELVTITGAKRGAGRRKRQRRVKAFLKQQESRRKFLEREQASKTQSTSS